MATFGEWLDRSREWPVDFNRLFTRTVYFWESHLPKAETLLGVMVDMLSLFNTMQEAKAAMKEAVHWAHSEGRDTAEESTIAMMAKRFYARSNLDKRPLNELHQPVEVKL